MILDISFEEDTTGVCVDFSENKNDTVVAFGELQIVNNVSVKIEDDIAYINY
jgi:hypothetical protein